MTNEIPASDESRDWEGPSSADIHSVTGEDPLATQELFVALYGQLRVMAQKAMSGQPVEHTLQPTALVNEAYLRLLGSGNPAITSRAHFLAVAAKAMRHLLVDHARKKNSGKRAAPGSRVALDSLVADFEQRAEDLEKLDLVLSKLALHDPAMALAVEMRYFAGASAQDTAEAVGMAIRSFERKFSVTRHYIRAQLKAS